MSRPVVLGIAALLSGIAACAAKPAPQATNAAPPAAPTSNAAAGKYQCPMHKDQVSADPNAHCPVCGMHMVKVTDK